MNRYLKKTVAIIITLTFIFTLSPVPPALALRPQQDAETDAQAVGKAFGVPKPVAKAKGTGEDEKVLDAFGEGRRNFLKTSALFLAGAALEALLPGCAPKRAPTRVLSPAPTTPPTPQPALPTPTTELMRKVQEAATKIKNMPDGRFTAMFWDTVNINPDTDFKNLADFGFNEVIVDGYRFIQGDMDDATIAQLILSAQQAGIRHFKFMMGDPSWPYEGREFAKQKTQELCARLVSLKSLLTQQGNSETAEIIEGIAIDNEPHLSNNWDFNLGPYCSLHKELREIAEGNGLTYDRIEAFWYTQDRVATGETLRNYTPDNRAVYLMSYRPTGEGTFGMSGYTGSKNLHIGGFDLVTSSTTTGYKDAGDKLPVSLSTYVDLSIAQRADTFRGAFIHAATIADLRGTLKLWREGMVSPEQTEPAVTEPQEETPAPEQEFTPPKPGSVKISVSDHSRSGGTTTFTLKISGLTPEQRERAGVVVMKYIDAYYPQPYQESIATISQDGTVEVQVEKRGSLGRITFFVVDTQEYVPQEYFHSESQIQGIWAKQGTSVRAALPRDPKDERLAFVRDLELDARRYGKRRQAIAAATGRRVFIQRVGTALLGGAAAEALTGCKVVSPKGPSATVPQPPTVMPVKSKIIYPAGISPAASNLLTVDLVPSKLGEGILNVDGRLTPRSVYSDTEFYLSFDSADFPQGTTKDSRITFEPIQGSNVARFIVEIDGRPQQAIIIGDKVAPGPAVLRMKDLIDWGKTGADVKYMVRFKVITENPREPFSAGLRTVTYPNERFLITGISPAASNLLTVDLVPSKLGEGILNVDGRLTPGSVYSDTEFYLSFDSADLRRFVPGMTGYSTIALQPLESTNIAQLVVITGFSGQKIVTDDKAAPGPALLRMKDLIGWGETGAEVTYMVRLKVVTKEAKAPFNASIKLNLPIAAAPATGVAKEFAESYESLQDVPGADIFVYRPKRAASDMHIRAFPYEDQGRSHILDLSAATAAFIVDEEGKAKKVPLPDVCARAIEYLQELQRQGVEVVSWRYEAEGERDSGRNADAYTEGDGVLKVRRHICNNRGRRYGFEDIAFVEPEAEGLLRTLRSNALVYKARETSVEYGYTAALLEKIKHSMLGSPGILPAHDITIEVTPHHRFTFSHSSEYFIPGGLQDVFIEALNAAAEQDPNGKIAVEGARQDRLYFGVYPADAVKSYFSARAVGAQPAAAAPATGAKGTGEVVVVQELRVVAAQRVALVIDPDDQRREEIVGLLEKDFGFASAIGAATVEEAKPYAAVVDLVINNTSGANPAVQELLGIANSTGILKLGDLDPDARKAAVAEWLGTQA